MKKLKLSKVKSLAQHHLAGRWLNQDLNSSLSDAEIRDFNHSPAALAGNITENFRMGGNFGSDLVI